MLVPFALDNLELQAPLPVNLFDANGVLLLRRGEALRDDAHRALVASRGAQVDEDELREWTFRYTAEIDRKLRSNARLDEIASVARPMGVEPQRTPPEQRLFELWADLHTSLGLLLHQGAQAQNFLPRLEQVERRIEQTLAGRSDDSLFVLVQMLLDRALGYSTSHALLCALLCHLVGRTLLPQANALRTLVRAALTMNIGMTRLQDQLALRHEPLDAELRARVAQHPQQSKRILQALGVDDTLWLGLVQTHHQAREPLTDLAAAAPPECMAHLLSVADVFVARISPRASRKGLPAHEAARDAYLKADGQPSPLGAAFVKVVGIYIPGSYVQLASGELAVVARRQRRANEPMVFALVGRSGMPLGEPALRDTSEPAYQVKAGVPADEVRVRVNPAKLLARL